MLTKPKCGSLSLVKSGQMRTDNTSSELGTFCATHEPASGSVHATYLLTGELSPKHVNGDAMDIDGRSSSAEDGEHVSEMRMTLVGEQDLERQLAPYSARKCRSLNDSCEIDVCAYILRARLLPLTLTGHCKYLLSPLASYYLMRN